MNRTGEDMAKALREHRSLLLACEAIGWLHMAGKAKADFLRKHGGQPNDYDYERWFELENPPFAWSDLLQWVKDKYLLSGNGWPSSLTEVVTKHTKRDPGLLGLLQAGHAMASGIEKNVPRDTSRYLNQDATHMWLATAFGHPVRNLLRDPPELLQPGGWERLLDQIGRLLDELKRLGTNPPPDIQPWWRWREEAIGRDGWLRRAFETTLAETRVPNNDVTLWDQSYVAAALFRSAVAGLVLLENPANGIWEDPKSQTRWRVLTVGFGAEHYETRAVRIGDWTGAQQEIEAFFDDLRRLIEVDLAVGSLLYRDDEVLAFTFPGQRFDDESTSKNRSLDDNAAGTLRGWIEEQVEELARARKFETPPLCELSKSTRSFIPMASAAAKVRRRLAVPVHRSWTIPDIAETQGHVCPVCQVRFSGRAGGKEANPKQRPCSVCRERRKGRLDAWLRERTDTIWITELADDNDRVALLGFSFDLGPWLDGSRVDSLRAQSIAAWRRFNSSLPNRANPIDVDNPTVSLTAHVESFVRSPTKATSGSRKGKLDDAVLASINEGFPQEDDIAVFYGKMVEDRADSPPPWDEVQNDPAKAAHWLVHQLFRKNASPGRVYRFWRTAETFFDELIPVFRKAAAAHANCWRTRRLVLTADAGSRTGWRDRETYATRWRDAPLELLYREESKDFLTICNLARVLRPEERGTALKGQSFELEGDEGDEGSLTVSDVSEPEGLGVYTPLIVLDRRPARFRALVPLSAAPACIEATVKKWEEEFGRVWDRMPLRAGVVAFPRMTPFQAVVEATRNLEDDLSRADEKPWRVVESRVRDGVAALLVARPDGARELVTVPATLPDGRADDHYPYLAVTSPDRRCPRDFVTPPAENREREVYRHVADLAPGDGVRVAPSRFGMLFMGSTAQRFEPLSVHYLSEWRRLRQTWGLLCRTAPSVTALRGAWSTLADARERWQQGNGSSSDISPSWESLARSVLANDLGAKPPELDTLVEAAVSGVLERTLEWHLRILKLDLEERT